MEKFMLVNVDVVVKVKAGTVVNEESIVDLAYEQSAPEEMSNKVFFDTVDEAKQALADKDAKVRADRTLTGGYEVNAKYWRIESVELDEDGDIVEGQDVWEATPFEIACK